MDEISDELHHLADEPQPRHDRHVIMASHHPGHHATITAECHMAIITNWIT